MPNMVGANLSSQQFGATQPAQAGSPQTPNPTSPFLQPPTLPGLPQHQPHELSGGGAKATHNIATAIGVKEPSPMAEAPLPGMAGSYGSVKSAAAWRIPQGRVLPLGKGTFGSVFNPFGNE